MLSERCGSTVRAVGCREVEALGCLIASPAVTASSSSLGKCLRFPEITVLNAGRVAPLRLKIEGTYEFHFEYPPRVVARAREEYVVLRT